MNGKSLGVALVGFWLLAGCTSNGESAPVANVTSNEISSSSSSQSKSGSYTLAEVEKHNSKDDCWMVIDGSVYDVTSFIGLHPGGAQILLGCGTEATSLFSQERKHEGQQAQSELGKLEIGKLSVN